MLTLDTNHLREWSCSSPAGKKLRVRLHQAKQPMGITIVTVDEQMRGWMAEMNRRDPHGQVYAYERLQAQVTEYAEWLILPWDNEAADLFLQHRRNGIRIGTMDLKIACIIIAHDATLLTRNTRDFSQVPGLRFENWLD